MTRTGPTPSRVHTRIRTSIIDALFLAYRRVLSPALHTFAAAGGQCPYQPTCSEYAALACSQHGFLRGGAMAVWRLLRCNPLSRGGWDPVPYASERRAL